MNSRNLLRRALRGLVSTVTYPRAPEEYLQLFNRLSSAHYTRAVVTRVRRETADCATIDFVAGAGWVPHRAGQWARIGVEVAGRRIWRPYSISAAEGSPPSITVRDQGTVSAHLSRATSAGDVLYVERSQGQFVLTGTPAPLLFVVAGSGITPVMSMLRTLMPRRPDHDVALFYVSRSSRECLFAEEIRELADQFPGLRPRFWFTAEHGRPPLAGPGDLRDLCPDAARRKIYSSGPDDFVSAVSRLAQRGSAEILVERFTVKRQDSGGSGGEVRFTESARTVPVPGTSTILEASEDSGMTPPHGCRMGICQSCVLPMTGGSVKNIRTGELTTEPGLVKTCINTPQGSVEIRH